MRNTKVECRLLKCVLAIVMYLCIANPFVINASSRYLFLADTASEVTVFNDDLVSADKSSEKSDADEDADKKDASDSTNKRTKAKYDKTFIKDKTCRTYKLEGSFMTLHRVNKKLYIELPKKYLNKEMLIASTITGVSDANLGSIGFKPQDPMHVKFQMIDSTIFLQEVNILPDFDRTNPQMAESVSLNGMDPIIDSYALFCETPDKSAVVFEVTTMFTGNNARLAPIKTGRAGSVNMTASFKNSGSALDDVKVFKDNVSIKSILSYTVSANLLGLILLKNNDPFSVKVTRTILLLPEKKMQPRIADSRVGIFLSSKYDLNADMDQISSYSMINRWDVQPSDSVAWAKGEIVEPTKNIVFYLDSAFPADWKEPAKRGVLRWNKAFEKIGLKNVIKVLDFPTKEEEPDFDPDNLKYSCIRYVPAQIANAMGPSWVDPSTGEIINASIIVYNDIIKLANNWRFCHTAQIDERVRGKRLPLDVVDETIEYVIAHEAGHCLGFMHNMSASAAYPTDSLRSATFTQKYGTTASIMDYARFNYVAQPSDKGVCLTPPFLGAYDYYLVKYAYCPILEANGIKEESKILESWVDEKAGDPIYRYGRQQIIQRYDPSAIEEDLGDDPIKAAEYGTKNIKYILEHFNEWMPDEMDPDATLRAQRYEELAKQYNRYLNAVMLNIGGIYLTNVKPGTPGKTAVSVPKQRQRGAMLWTLDQLKNCSWINDREITDKFPMRVELQTIIQYYTALELFSTYENVILSSHIARSAEEAYTLNDWLDDIYDNVWKDTESKLTAGERILQNLYIMVLSQNVSKKTNLVKVKSLNSFSNDCYFPSLSQIINFGLDDSQILEPYVDLLREYELENGVGSVAGLMYPLYEYGKSGYGWQYKTNIRTINESKSLFNAELKRIRKLVSKRLPFAKGETKAHYYTILKQIDDLI